MAVNVGTFMVVIASFLSCQPGKKGVFGKTRSAHEQYTDRLDKAGLLKSALARKWTASAQKSLNDPARITLPHKEAGYFAAGEPDAVGLSCNLRRGATLNISVQTVPANASKVFVELWKTDTVNHSRERIAEGDSTFRITHEVETDGQYLVRLQPELLASLEYTLTITTQPSLAFPVDEKSKPAMISFWNDKRDAGRNHEGVDIKAPFRSPAVAAANGYIRSVTTNNLGGKVIFMRPEGKDYVLYYAHLDSQMVSDGQTVKLGDTIGLVGNTGNAVHTPPHLHFGIYSRGAVDPLPFIDNRKVNLKEICADLDALNKMVRTNKKVRVYQLPNEKSDTVSVLQQGTAIKVVSATNDWYRIRMPAAMGYVSREAVTQKPFTNIKTDSATKLLDDASVFAASMDLIPSGTTLSVLGTSSQYYLVRYKDRQGWVQR